MRIRCLVGVALLSLVNGAFADEVTAVSEKLAWQTDLSSTCGGYYQNTLRPVTIPNEISTDGKIYNILADETTYVIDGVSILKGHVKITQPDRELTADIAHIYPDDMQHQTQKLDALGNVHLQTSDKLIIAESASMDLKNKNNSITLNRILYRLALNEVLSAWGNAEIATQTEPNIFEFENATYTTCPPTEIACWMIKSPKLHLNQKTGRGYATHSVLLIKNIPVFYLPYFNFPIDKRRQSGFLTPNISTRQGITLKTPYYFNLAPNYDLTLAPEIMLQRGVMLNSLFRYLTTNHAGSISANAIPSDRGWSDLQKEAQQKWSNQPTYEDLMHASKHREAFAFRDTTRFSEHWNTEVSYNYVSDDYFIQHFGGNLLDNSNNQLLRQARINYADNTWQFLTNLQAYQTLHPVNQSTVDNPYQKLPQLLLNGNFPDQIYHTEAFVNSEFVYFSKPKNPGQASYSVQGSRFNAKPAISIPFRRSYGYITPRAQLQMIKYDLRDTNDTLKDHPSETIPLFDIKSGLYFDRSLSFFQKPYQQTLEPTLYYLYVPYHAQHFLPIFDTSLDNFNYNLIFKDNRFSGIDRIGDTNQISMGLTSRFIDSETGNEKASINLGRIYYLTKRKVTLCNAKDCSVGVSETRMTSPFAGLLTYNLAPHWSLSGEATWDTRENSIDNKSAGIQYQWDNAHVINMNYRDTPSTDILGRPAIDNNALKQLGWSTYWRVMPKWNLLANWNYNLRDKHPQAYFYGIEYDSCCFAIRLIAARTFIGLDPNNKVQYDQGYYIEIALKGLSTLGNGDSGGLTQSIAGHTDMFGQ